MDNRKAYLIVNTTLIFIFLFAITYVLFTEETLHCYYREQYGIICKTCGITRDFKSILTFQFDGLINPLSKYYFGGFFTFFFTRIGVIFLLRKDYSLRNILRFDVLYFLGFLLYMLLV